MDIRWLTAFEITELVNPAMQMHGWAELNTESCRVLGAFEGNDLVEVFALQLHPLLGPMVRLDNERRDAGETSRELATRMYDYLQEQEARGFLAVADSPVTARLCERFDMKKIEAPVYGFVRSAVEV